jgi:hypothetical protein
LSTPFIRRSENASPDPEVHLSRVVARKVVVRDVLVHDRRPSLETGQPVGNDLVLSHRHTRVDRFLRRAVDGGLDDH